MASPTTSGTDNISTSASPYINSSSSDSTNGTSDTSDEHTWSFEFSVILACVLSVSAFCTVVGNCMVLMVIVRHRGMRTRTNLFLLNLAVADLLVGLFVVPFSIATLVQNGWIFGRSLCLLNGWMNGFCLIAAFHTLMYISIHKYFSIVRPLNNPLKLNYIIVMMAAAWIWAAVCSTLNITLLVVEYKPGTSQCGPRYPNTLTTYLVHGLLQTTVIVVPATILVFCYVRMFMEIKKHSQRLRTNSTVEEDFILSQQKKVTITLFIVLATFVMMALPYHIYATYTTIEKDKTHFPTYINPLAYMFLYLSSMCNPIIYAFRSPAFREGYKEILCQTPNYVISDESDQVPRTRRISFLISSLRQASSFRSANRNVKICPESRALNPKPREAGDNQSKPKFGRQKSLLELLRSTRRSRGQSVVHRNGDVIIMKGGKIVSVRREATPFLDKFNTLKETNERDRGLAAGLAGPGHVMFGLLYEGVAGEENGAVECDKDVTESNTSLASHGKLKQIRETGYQNDEMSHSQENGLSLSHLENKNISSTQAHVNKFIFDNDDQKYLENESASFSEQSQYSTSGIELSNSEVARPTFLQFSAKGLSETDISEDTGNNFKITSLPDYLTSSIESAINSPNSGGVVIQLDDDDDIISVMPLTPNTREHLAKSDLNISQTRPDPSLAQGRIPQLSQSSEHILKRPPAIARFPSVEFLDPPVHVFRSQSNVSMHKGRSKLQRRGERSQSPDVNLSSKSSFLLSHFSPRKKHTMQL